jgi:hypothetical protein
MQQLFKQFLKKTLIFSAFVAFAGVVVSLLVPAIYITPSLPFLILFFMGITIYVYYSLLQTVEKKFAKFINRFMAMTGLKLLLFLASIVVYLLIFPGDAVPFLISFFILYIVYTIYEITSILAITKPDVKK